MITTASHTGVENPRCRVCNRELQPDEVCDASPRPWRTPILTCVTDTCSDEATRDGLDWARWIP